MKTFNLTTQIDVRSTCSNIDVLYGPYSSIQEACEVVSYNRRALGRTVGIIDKNSILEYWWKSGLNDEDLIKKVEELSLSLALYGNSEFSAEEGDNIVGQFIVDGSVGVKKAILYQIVDNRELFIQEYINIGKKVPFSFTIPSPNSSGVYKYRIKVLDNFDNYAVTDNGNTYIEYTVSYGSISVNYNLSVFNTITVKNYNSVSEIPFQISISVRDNSIKVTDVRISDYTDSNSDQLSISLIPSSGYYLGTNTYKMPSSTQLKAFNGKKCSIIINYTENDEEKSNIKDLFTLLDINTIEIVSEIEDENKNFYVSIPSYYTFQLNSAVEDLPIIISPNEESDFNFEKSTVISYKKISLKIIPKHEISNAQIILNYRYIYNNIEYTGQIKKGLGSIYQLPEPEYYNPNNDEAIKRESIIYADENDYTGIENGQYYKTIYENINFECTFPSFILDTYCKINEQNDKNIEYIKINYGNTNVITITEDEISSDLWKSLYTDTPLNEWVQIGIGVNLRENITNNKTAFYHCVYINGIVVKSVLVDNSAVNLLPYKSGSKLSVTIGEGIYVQKCFLYYKNDEYEIDPNVKQSDSSIIYNNYKLHVLNFAEPQDLPKLRFINIVDPSDPSNSLKAKKYFELINNYKKNHDEDLIKHITTFGTIGSEKVISMSEYDPYYDKDDVFYSDATLFRQSVDIKKPAQADYAVLCEVEWSGNILENIIVEVHTQGTSTLVYTIPNFKFTFWKIVNDQTIEKYYPEFIKKDDTEDYYRECIYTAKADFMDSSHLNNTPTCVYYNKLIQNLRENKVITGSPSAQKGMLDAIVGFPIIMEVSDTATEFTNSIFTNIGSFMLNIDKSGESLGFEIEVDDQSLSCISFEGTSNDNNNGASGRFDIPEGMDLKNYYNDDILNTEEIEGDYNDANNVIGLSLDSLTSSGDLVKNLPYVKWCKFLSDGLEYRYPDSDIYKEKDGTLNKIMNLSHFISLYKMWWWVYKSDTLSQSVYKENFIKHFDLHYCIIYFINLMIYAQTDNLGKNAMFDCWDGEHWYPRPYDLDSAAGLDNNGNDNVATFVEIKPEFSLNYDINKSEDYEWLSENYLLEEPVIDKETNNVLYPASTIKYGRQTYDRYHYSSNKSKLWYNFYKNYKDEISNFYINLRRNYNYSPESIIDLCESILISKLGTAQYNKDFQNKYLGNIDQRLAYGNRWYKFKKWLINRFAFCDSYFGAFESAMYNIESRINYFIKINTPQYIAQQYQGESNRDVRFVTDSVNFTAGSGGATIITLLANQPSVLETDLFKKVVLNQGSTNYTNLISLDVSGNTHPSFINITSVTGKDLSKLKYLNISNSFIQSLEVPINVKTLMAQKTNLNSLQFAQNNVVEEAFFNDSIFANDVSFSMMNNLKKLDLTNCIFNGNVTFENINNLQELILDNTIFNGEVIISSGVNIQSFDFSNLTVNSISFIGSDLIIKNINFHNTTFKKNVINVNAICKNIEELNFYECKGLKHIEISDPDKRFNQLKRLSLYGSSIESLGENMDYFDCIYFDNIDNLEMLYLNDLTTFNFRNTSIKNIKNINWEKSGTNLFRNCINLESVEGSIIINSGDINYMFYKCSLLKSIPDIDITENVKSAAYTFAGSSLPYSFISAIIKKCSNVNNFSSALRCVQFDTNLEINLSELFTNNIADTLNLTSFLSQYTSSSDGNFKSVSNTITIQGILPPSTTTTSQMFYGYSEEIKIPYELIKNADKLSDTSGMFANSNKVSFVNASNNFKNVITKDFLPSSLINISGMFYNSNVITTDPDLFINLVNLTNTNATFGSSTISKFQTNENGTLTDFSLNVSTLWANNSLIQNISGCFVNRYNVYCNSLVFHDEIDDSKSINISGLFGLNTTDRYSSSRENSSPITINIGSIVPKLTTNNIYSIPNNSRYSGGPGVFQNRKVFIVDNTSEIFSKLSGSNNNLFKFAILYIPESVEYFDLSNVTSCNQMFRGCRLYTSSDNIDHVYNLEDRKFIDIILPEGCNTFSQMFQDSSILKDLPMLPSNASNLSQMYQGCVINTPNLVLPANYFQKCCRSLTNTSYMFYNNMYLTELGYNESRGLFEECINLINVDYMFSNAIFLNGGVPINLFGKTNLDKLINLSYMFDSTSIIYNVKDDSNKWINADTITPLINLTNIEGMFRRNRINSSTSTIIYDMNQTVYDTITDKEVAVIDPYIFATKKLTNINKLFEHTNIDPPSDIGRFQFQSFAVGVNAFFGSRVKYIENPFVNDTLSLSNVNKMFYQPSITGQVSEVTNLCQFIDTISKYPNIRKNSIAGNLVNDCIADEYKKSTEEDESNQFWGNTLVEISSDSSTLEDTWVNYGRYYYN